MITRSASLDQLDEDIAALAESLRILRSRRNAAVFISCLPSEILATIFTHIVEEESFKSYVNTGNTDAPLWQWRQVALECPTLWAFIDCVHVDWLSIMFQRSKKAALVVTYSAPLSLIHCVEQLLSQLPRIKVLQLCSFPSDVNRIFHCLSSQPAPLLQIFKFSVMEGRHLGIVKPISDAIFQGRAPHFGAWTSSLRRIGSSSYPTLSQLLSALRRMPGLELLMLELPCRNSGDTVLFDHVPLTQLKNIALDACTIPTAVSLFSHLVLPVDVGIALNLAQSESPEGFSNLFSVIYKNPDESGPVMRSLGVSLTFQTFRVQFSTSMTFKSEDLWKTRDGDISLSIQFERDTSTTNPTIVFDMCRMVPHRKIQSLFVSSCLHLTENFWHAGSADLLELESIHLKSASIGVGGLIAALQSEGAQSSDIMYPSLHALELDNIDFACDEPQALRDIVIKRAKHGIGIHRFRLAKCYNLMNDGVQLLREVVADVDWDGHSVPLTDPFNGRCCCASCGGEYSDYSDDDDTNSED
ncbi:uncharacterized protein EDB91DRAFT_1095163 [Suillus paluster]|uniref:uncharacterized protein n=1 Tax=Suillus paluster TaxID=48578 RepID=UPI001B86BC33|nr:uncharacterized protein EDB91DRAFT_1095163 [Suillus paluster]KAG1756917.1 hypothetical protein EDB91DRAFT_1095163 [Suillus paluster]